MLELSPVKFAMAWCLNYVVSVEYIRDAVKLVEKGAQKKQARHWSDVDRPELIVCCLSDNDNPAAGDG